MKLAKGLVESERSGWIGTGLGVVTHKLSTGQNFLSHDCTILSTLCTIAPSLPLSVSLSSSPDSSPSIGVALGHHTPQAKITNYADSTCATASCVIMRGAARHLKVWWTWLTALRFGRRLTATRRWGSLKWSCGQLATVSIMRATAKS